MATTAPSSSPASTSLATTTAPTPPTTTGPIQGTDNNNSPYGSFKVAIKVAPHLSSSNPDGGAYVPTTPLQSDGTCQSSNGYWQAARKGPTGILGFSDTFAAQHFVFQVTPAAKYFGISGGPPNVLAPGASFDVDYGTTFVVAPSAPLRDLTVWVGNHPQLVH